MDQDLMRHTTAPRRNSPPRRRFRPASRGQGLVEFALVLPLVLVIVLAALDLGRAYLGWVVLNNAARVGANYAALHPKAWGAPGNAAQQAEFEAQVRQARAESGISLNGCDGAGVPVPAFPDGTDLGDYARLDLQCEFQPITPFIGALLSSTGTVPVLARSEFPIRTGTVDLPPGAPGPVCPALAEFTWAIDAANPLRVDFTDTSLPAGASGGWLWDFGDALGAAVENPSHTYAQAGTYTVTLHVNGCSQMSHDVTVTEPPPTPGPGQTPAPSPAATPLPTPSPTPGCAVPSFIEGTRKSGAQDRWTAAGFTTTVLFQPGPGNYKIEYQSIVGGQGAPCNVVITVGPNPQP